MTWNLLRAAAPANFSLRDTKKAVYGNYKRSFLMEDKQRRAGRSGIDTLLQFQRWLTASFITNATIDWFPSVL